MPQYYFDIFDGIDIVDEDGTTCVDLQAAKNEASLLAAELLRDNPARLWKGHEWTVRVRDERNLTLFEIVFLVNLAPALSG